MGEIEPIFELIGIVRTSFGLTGKVQILSEHETYDGNYRVRPTGDEQRLLTSDKLMTDDVIVESIPYYEVSNTSGGTTAIIGGDT